MAKTKMKAKRKVKKKHTAEEITMICIQFCESKGGIINREMDLATIECIRYQRDLAIKKLRHLVKHYGNASDKRHLASIEDRL